MDKTADSLKKIMCCPVCKSSLIIKDTVILCTKCGEGFSIVDGIPDFYPADNLFSPQRFNIKSMYEEYGEKVSRPSSFQNLRRKNMTLEMIEGGNCLELGAAEGWMTEEIVARVDTLISCDIALSYLKRAKAKKIDAGFMRVDVHYLPFEDNSFDTVILTEVLEHVYSPYRVLEEVHRVLNTAGILIISVPNNMTFSKFIQHLFNRFPPDHDAHLSFYDMYGIGRLLNFAGFRIEQRKTAFIYLPVLKRLFYFNGIQNLMNKLFNNFGDKIIIKARKTNQSLWDNY